jgi:hypothetical protein
MWKLGLRPRSFISGNICFEFSLYCFSSVGVLYGCVCYAFFMSDCVTLCCPSLSMSIDFLLSATLSESMFVCLAGGHSICHSLILYDCSISVFCLLFVCLSCCHRSVSQFSISVKMSAYLSLCLFI